mmetsp:Transcript_4287/g.10142  ORF Transcript_4287/g.10142 Transcript_4287/m.10142 type:complete len:238 (+) Transcript_4287:1096-1809(+)
MCQHFGKFLSQIGHDMLAGPMDAKTFALRSHKLRQQPSFFAFHLLYDEVQEGSLPNTFQVLQFAQRFHVEAIGSATSSSSVQVVPHGQDCSEQLLQSRRVLQPLTCISTLCFRRGKPVVVGLKTVEEAPQLQAKAILWDLDQLQNVLLGTVPGFFFLEGGRAGSDLRQLLFSTRRCIREEQLHRVCRQGLIIHGPNCFHDVFDARKEGKHAPELPPTGLLQEAALLGLFLAVWRALA